MEFMRTVRILLFLILAVLPDVGRADIAGSGDRNVPPEHRAGRSPLGIGFLWTAESQTAAGRLTDPADFVDVILGPGRLDIFEKVRPPVRIGCLALALEKNDARPFPGLKETIETLRRAGIARERVILAYNPERRPDRPAQEMDNLVASARRAMEMAQDYGAPLLIGPGLKEMEQREHLYPELAKCCDIWMIQSQRLQLDERTRKPVETAVYRERVKRIADRLREGNPRIQIFVQIVTTAERGTAILTAEQVAAFARSIEDIADAVRIYGAGGQQLGDIMERMRSTP